MTKRTPNKATKRATRATPTTSSSSPAKGHVTEPKTRRRTPPEKVATDGAAAPIPGGPPALRKTIEDVSSGSLTELLDATAWRLDAEVVGIMAETGQRAPVDLLTRSKVLRALLVAESLPDAKGLRKLLTQADAYLRDKVGRRAVADGPHPWPKRTAAEGIAASIKKLLGKPQTLGVLQSAGALPAARARVALKPVAHEVVDLVMSWLLTDVPATYEVLASLPRPFAGATQKAETKALTILVQKKGAPPAPEKLVRAIIGELGGKHARNLFR